jgi:hypothetical protein
LLLDTFDDGVDVLVGGGGAAVGHPGDDGADERDEGGQQ